MRRESGDQRKRKQGKENDSAVIDGRRSKSARFVDEEIESEDEQFADVTSGGTTASSRARPSPDSESEDDFIPEERRVALAKDYLERLGMGTKTDEAVAEKLQREAEVSSKNVNYEIADKGHNDGVTAVSVGVDDKTKAVTASKDCSLILWDLLTGAKVTFAGRRRDFDCGGHFAQCLDVTVSEDCRTVVSCGEDRLLRIWDTRASTDKCTTQLEGHSKRVTVWCMRMMCCRQTFYGHTSAATCMDLLTPDRPITGGEDLTMRTWKIDSGSHLLYQHQTQPIDSVMQLNAHRSFSGSQDGVGSREPIAHMEKVHGGSWVTGLVSFLRIVHANQGCVRYSDILFSGSDDGVIRTWKVQKENTKGKKKQASLIQQLDKAINVAGVVNQITTTEDCLLAAVSREHRLGRWKNIKAARNGLLIVPLKYDIPDEA